VQRHSGGVHLSRRHSAEVCSTTEGIGVGVRSAAEGVGAELRRPDKEKLQIFLKIFFGYFLSITAELWV